jgi:Uma2 family endonuclease
MRTLSFISRERLTQREFAEWVRRRPAADVDQYELLDGHVVREPPAGWPHGEVAANLLFAIAAHVRSHGLGKVFDSSQAFELPSGDTVEPDISFVSKERWRRPAKRNRFLRIVPDLIVEIVSPSTRDRDQGEKRRIYERNGVREYWLVDDPGRCIVRFDLVAGRFDEGTTFRDGDEISSRVIEGFSHPVSAVLTDE